MYTYALCKTPTTPLDFPPGIAAPVQITDAAPLSALIEPDLALEHLQDNETLLVQAVLDHDRVIRRLFQQITILPLRFGTWFRSQQDLLTHLHTNQQAYLKQLTLLEGKAEYALKLIPIECPELSIAPDVKGKDYFLAKKQHYQTQLLYQQQQQEAIRHITQAVVQAYSHCQLNQSNETQPGVQTIYLLSAIDSELSLCQHIQALQQRYPQWQLLLGEALPPYHFVADCER